MSFPEVWVCKRSLTIQAFRSLLFILRKHLFWPLGKLELFIYFLPASGKYRLFLERHFEFQDVKLFKDK